MWKNCRFSKNSLSLHACLNFPNQIKEIKANCNCIKTSKFSNFEGNSLKILHLFLKVRNSKNFKFLKENFSETQKILNFDRNSFVSGNVLISQKIVKPTYLPEFSTPRLSSNLRNASVTHAQTKAHACLLSRFSATDKNKSTWRDTKQQEDSDPASRLTHSASAFYALMNYLVNGTDHHLSTRV